MGVITNGKIQDKNIEIKTYSSLEHGEINKVTSIVLHRTDSTTASSTIQEGRGGKGG